jgi:hypothetical protein
VQPRVSAREAYPRRAKHNIVAEGGNRRSAIATLSQITRSPRSLASFSWPRLPTASVRAIASSAERGFDPRREPFRPMRGRLGLFRVQP